MDQPLFRRLPGFKPLPTEKFSHPDTTAKGEARAKINPTGLDTLWFNTGTLCNIACQSCYIESSPRNDRLVYLTLDEVKAFLDEIPELGLKTREIAFTGGEPFMNPDFPDMIDLAAARGYEVLILTNAMQPMLRKRIKARLLALTEAQKARLTFRVSLDHFGQENHELERGDHTWKFAMEGMDWLGENGFRMAVAGRQLWQEAESDARTGYEALFAAHGWKIDAHDPAALVLFPEMDEQADVAEITTDCWSILNVNPASIMCASSRMVIKRKGADTPQVLPCTLIAYDERFEMGETLAKSLVADGPLFDKGAVKLMHPHCARFCVLGGASCSG